MLLVFSLRVLEVLFGFGFVVAESAMLFDDADLRRPTDRSLCERDAQRRPALRDAVAATGRGRQCSKLLVTLRINSCSSRDWLL